MAKNSFKLLGGDEELQSSEEGVVSMIVLGTTHSLKTTVQLIVQNTEKRRMYSKKIDVYNERGRRQGREDTLHSNHTVPDWVHEIVGSIPGFQKDIFNIGLNIFKNDK